MTANDLAAGLHGVDVVDGGRTLRLTGTCRREGTDGETPSPLDLFLHIVDAGGRRRHTATTVPQRRYEREAVRWTGFIADIPLDQLPTGRLTFLMEVDGNASAAGVNATTT